MIGNVLIIVLIVLLSALLLVHSLPNLKIYLFMSKKSCNFAPQMRYINLVEDYGKNVIDT